MKQPRFLEGQPIILREILRRRVWAVRPVIVVQDGPELMAFYLPPGTVWKCPMAAEGLRATVTDRAKPEWKLHDDVWVGGGVLRLAVPGEPYSVLVFPDAWYVNLEEPLRRTALGFDYLDQFLDAIVSPDLSEWHWKDEDELREAQALGLMAPQEADDMYRVGEQVVAMLRSGRSIFNGWENWYPDPSLAIPTLPDNWDIV